MRQLILILTLISLTAFKSGTINDQPTKKEANTLVTNFMNTMKNSLFEPVDTLEKYLLPTELRNYKEDNHYQGINEYVIGDFKIIRTELPFVTVKIKHPKADERKWNWAKELTFKIESFQGQVYIVPSGSSGNYVNPWWTTKTI